MTGYDTKSLRLSHRGPAPTTLRVEVDLTGEGLWVTYRSFELPPGAEVEHTFPGAFQAYWLRVTAAVDTIASAQLEYR